MTLFVLKCEKQKKLFTFLLSSTLELFNIYLSIYQTILNNVLMEHKCDVFENKENSEFKIKCSFKTENNIKLLFIYA